jgi:tryptophan synthase alpha chain
MSRIAATFERLTASREGAYIPYVCCGDLGKEFTGELIARLSRAGADVIELGLPFSDPLADGPTIQAAMVRSLSAGFKVASLFDIISGVRSSGVETPIVVMTYYNPVLRMGLDVFCKRLADAGADGILPVDLPMEESGDLDRIAGAHGLDVIRLVSPTTDDERMEKILGSASGFVYAVSISGVTGQRDSLPHSAIALLKRLRAKSDLPIAVGFGISNQEQVRQALTAGASGVVEGSALINIYARVTEEDGTGGLDLVERHAREMKESTKGHVQPG